MKRRYLIVLALSFVALLVLIAPLVTLGLILPAVQQAREEARRAEVAENLRQVGIALQQYQVREAQSVQPANESP